MNPKNKYYLVYNGLIHSTHKTPTLAHKAFHKMPETVQGFCMVITSPRWYKKGDSIPYAKWTPSLQKISDILNKEPKSTDE